MPLRPKRKSIKPSSMPVHTNPDSMDFEKRRLLVTQVDGSTIKSIMPAISDAIVCYDGVVISYDGDTVYKL